MLKINISVGGFSQMKYCDGWLGVKSIYVGCNPVGSFLGVMLIEVTV
jgi:hypothetical protein